MKNNSSQGKIRKITAKVLVVLLAVVMAVSVLPALSADIFPATNAAVELDVNHPDLGYINGQLASYPAGTVVNLNLYTDINFTDASADVYDSSVTFTGLVIPTGLTVNLYMNGNNIVFSRPSGGAYKLTNVTGVHNKGTLNVFAGGTRGNSIIIENIRTGAKCTEKEDVVYFNLEGIKNEGELTLNSGVTVSVTAQYEFSEFNDNCQEQIAIGATAVYNSANAKCTVNSATINAYAKALSRFDIGGNLFTGADYDPCHCTAVAYGIYDGYVTVNGSTNISAQAFTESYRETSGAIEECGRSNVTGIAYGIVSRYDVNILSARSISARSKLDIDESTAHEDASTNVFAGGIYTLSGKKVYLPDGDIVANNSSYANSGNGGAINYSVGTIVTNSELPYTAREIVDKNHSYGSFQGYKCWPNKDNIKAGTFYDEIGNVYNTNISNANGTHPTNIVRGALAGKTRVHIVYRYWIDDSLQTLDTSVVDVNGNKGFTYAPQNNTPKVVKTPVSFSGITGGLVANNGSKIAYTSGGEPHNENYWDFSRITYQVAGKETFSEYDVVKPGTELIDLHDAETLNNNLEVNGGSVFLFLDYIRKPVSYVKASVGTGKIVSTVYTGTNILASDIGLKIRDSFIEKDYTSEYNIDFNNDNLIPVTFTYTGTNTAGGEEIGTDGKLPVNAGVYEVTLHIDDSTEYNSDPKISKNRKGIEYSFQLTIEQAPVERGNLLREVNILYGQKLGEIIDFSKYSPVLLGSDTGITGSYSFENSADGTTCKDVGSGIVKVVWTPSYAENATVKNYAPTTFELRYVVGKGLIEIYPNAASIVYGDEADGQLFSSTIKGIADNDSQEYVRKILEDRITYSVIVNGTETAYTPGKVPAGEYVINAKVDLANLTGSLENYSFVCKQGADNPQGILTVEKRALKLQAAAEERGYDPDNNEITVKFNIVSGKFGDDDVSVTSVISTVADNTVGQHEYTLTEIGELTGSKAANYRIESVTSSSPDGKYYVYITKGQPDVAVPVIAEMFYRQDRTLGSINLNTTTPAIEGEWKWVDPDIRPTVNVTYYKAQFIPKDTSIYDIKIADVKINVKPTPVVISYQETVEYGDQIPNITGYTYTAAQDPSFSIDGVRTTGNVVPVTEYQKGSPVKNGGYTVRITANDYSDVDGNYTFTVKDGVITVVPKVITYTVENREIVYGDSFDTNSVNLTFDKNLLVGSDAETDLTADGRLPAFVIISDFNSQSDAGEYTLNANCTSTPSANYTIEVKPGQLNVKKAPLTIKGNDISLEYGSAVPADIYNAFTVSGIKKGEVLEDIFSGVISVSTEYVKNSPVTAEGYPVYVNADGALFRNYEVTVQNGLITVYKATPVIYNLPSATILHGQTLADAVFTGASVSVPGKFVYEFPTVAPDYKTGVYDYFKADFVPEDATNYNVVSGNIVNLTVTKTEVSGILAVTGVPMAGETLTVDGAGLVPSADIYTFTWYDENNAVLGTGAEFTPDENCAGKNIYVTASPDASSVYTGSVSSALIAVSATGLNDIRDILKNNNYSTYFDTNAVFGSAKEVVYNGEAQVITFTGKTDAVGAVTVRYNGSETAPVDAGTYTITVDIAAGKEYSPISNFTVGTLRIMPRSCTIFVNAADKVYDGTKTAQATLVKDIEVIGDDDVQFDATAVTYLFDSADAGKGKLVSAEYTSCLKGEDAKNYKGEIIVENNGSAVIEKMHLDIQVSAVSREYQDKNFDVDLEFGFIPVAGDEELVYVNRAKSKGTIVGNRNGVDNGVGQHEVNISGIELAGSKAGNYTVSYNNTASVEIIPATPSYSVPTVGGELYYDSTRTLGDIPLGNENWSWKAPDVVPQAGAHTYKAVYSPSDANYATVEYDIPVEIRKAVVTITAESFSVTYGDIAPTYRYTVRGLTGTDTIDENTDGYVLISCGYSSGSDVDTYPIKLVGTLSSDNYEFNFVNGTLTVNKRVAYVEVQAENRPYAAGNTDVNVKFTGISNLFGNDGEYVKLFKDSVTGTVDSDTAGTKIVQFTIPALTGDKAKNYTVSPSPAELTVEITKAAVPGVVLPTTGDVYFGFNLRSVIFTSGSLDTELGSFSMENPSAIADKIGTFSNVYKVVFTPKDENFATVSEYITINVLPANISAAFYLEGECKSGSTLEVNLRNAPADALDCLDFVWYSVDGPEDAPETGTVVATGTRTYKLTDYDSGKYIICSVTNKENSPYICNAVCVSDSEIEERQLSFWEKFVNWFYGLISNFTQLFSGLFG